MPFFWRGILYDKPFRLPRQVTRFWTGSSLGLSGGGFPVLPSLETMTVGAVGLCHPAPDREGIHLTAQYQGPQPPL